MASVEKFTMPRFIGLFLAVDAVLLGCVLLVTFIRPCSGPCQSGRAIEIAQPAVLLVSLDGYRADYLDRYEPPVLLKIAGEGVRAESMTPGFPTKTFPNHYSIVTGLLPANHGIVGNTIVDPEFDGRFSLGNRQEVRDGKWWGGEPIWVTVRKHGLKSAPFFWPGAEASIAGMRPDYWIRYDDRIPALERVSMVMDCLRLAERPSFLSIYFSDVDTEGHRSGPFSKATEEVISTVDGYLQALEDSLAALGVLDDVNLVIVSDHGMTETSRERVVILDDYIDMNDVADSYGSPNAMIWPKDGRLDDLVAALGDVPHAEFFRSEEIPERYQFRGHRRIAPLVGIAEEGWYITTRSLFDRNPAYYDGGTHGYAQNLPSMQALFVARGPAFRRGVVVEPFSIVEVYNIIAAVLAVEPSPNDGNLDSVQHVFKPDWQVERRPRVAVAVGANDNDSPRTCSQ